MKINLCVLFLVFGFAAAGGVCLSGEVCEKRLIHELTNLEGIAYQKKRDSLLENTAQLERLLQLDVKDTSQLVQKRILASWLSSRQLFADMLKGMSKHEISAMNSVKERKPNPISFAQAWAGKYGETLSPLAVEVVWKRADWVEWRTLAMLEILKVHGNDSILVPIVDRLAAERNENIRNSLLQVLSVKGGRKTLERLKARAQETKASVKVILRCARNVEERLEKAKTTNPASPPQRGAHRPSGNVQRKMTQSQGSRTTETNEDVGKQKMTEQPGDGE